MDVKSMECGMRMNKVCARCVTETRVVGPKGNEFHETRYLTRMTLKY